MEKLRRLVLPLMLAILVPAAGCVRDRGEAPAYAPVLAADFPDPFILSHGGGYLAYATNTGDGRVEANVQMASSPDLVHWTRIRAAGGQLHDAMPTLPSWSRRGWTWAPEVIEVDGRFILYFTAREAASGLQCVGAAVSADPRGPFQPVGEAPLVCQRTLGGTIDASPFRDADGQLYLYYKNDGNHPSFNKPTEIFAQRLSPDGLRLVGEPVALLRNDAGWEGQVVEAPTMVKGPASYILFYSANYFGWDKGMRASPYALGYAVCRGPMGPCRDAPGNPLLASRGQPPWCLSGPGHQTVIRAGGRSYIAFHAWGTTRGCANAEAGRFLYVAPLLWRDGEPVIGEFLRRGAN